MNTFIASFLLIIIFVLGVFQLGICQNVEERGTYFEGDIMGDVPIVDSRKKSGLVSMRRRWPNATLVYDFEPSYPSDLRRLFQSATQHISSRTCVKFKERKSENDYVRVISGHGCYSYLGRIGGIQPISLPRGCRVLGVFVHEIIHALGFIHEQSRLDRDRYVHINFGNIQPGTQINFQKYRTYSVSPYGVEYDYNSIMHYSKRAFSTDGKPTIEVLQKGAEIGQRRAMSKGDITKVNNMYCTRTS